MKRTLPFLCLLLCAALASAEDNAFQRPLCLVFDGIVGLGAYCDDSLAVEVMGYSAGAGLALHFNRDEIGRMASVQGLTLGAMTLGTNDNGWMPKDLLLTAGYRIGTNGKATGWYYVSSGEAEMSEWGQTFIELGLLCDRVYRYLPASGSFGYSLSGWGGFLGFGAYSLIGENRLTEHVGQTWNFRLAAWKQPEGLYFPPSTHSYAVEDSGWRFGFWVNMGLCFI